jgi:1,4-alpha-glucan branching enzyme
MERPAIVIRDPYLAAFEAKIKERISKIQTKILELSSGTNSLASFANGHHYFGLHRSEKGWIFREWAPNANGIWISGTFCGWELKEEYRFNPCTNGEWVLNLSENQIHHLDEYKLWISWPGGGDYRLPLYANRVVQDEVNKVFNAQVWDPPAGSHPVSPLKTDLKGEPDKPLLIYEAHVGMSSEKGMVNSFNSFRNDILPRIVKLGYNTLQLMAVQEHPYYGSFGYHVSNFFAVSSRFGTPDDLRDLISSAHENGMKVIMDIVHSHAVKNTLEGPGLYDGSPGMLFHTDQRRDHPAWDSLCFDYGKNETLHFLLSNCKYWIEEYDFDGFRFDGVTSMLYYDHGLGKAFTNYDAYFDAGIDEDALIYLGMANSLIHEIKPDAITVAEDMSGLPGLAAQVGEGGLGFDYRLAMGIPDFWIRLLKETPDENWNVGQILWELTNRRADEKTVSYVESHDQALVGDKTVIFRLADKEMYSHMARVTPSLIIDRAIALHKMIRLITVSTHGGGYLNFMGNEFGHPEWIDFPRPGNDWSYQYARRQWDLADNKDLRYFGLNEFDRQLISLIQTVGQISPIRTILIQEKDQVLAFERGNLIFVFNFNPMTSYTGYGIAVKPAEYNVILNSDSQQFGGFGRIDENITYDAQPMGKLGSDYQLLLYLPSRVGLVFKAIPPKRVR